MPATRPPFRIDHIGLLLAVAVLAVLLVKHRAFFHDDAFITLRYALNLAQTGLPQWNPGEWAEGYTSLLHMAAIGGLIRLGLAPVWAAQALNGAAALALLWLTFRAAGLAQGPAPDRAARLFTVLAVAATPSIAIWVLGGLEAVMVAALLMAGLCCLLADLHTPRPRLVALAALAFAGAVLTRLDASVFIAGCGLGLVAAGHGPLSRRLARAVFIVGLPAAVAFAQMGVRLSVYGEAFPLTFYAKADLPLVQRLASGVPYLARAAVAVPVLALAVIAALLAGLGGRLRPEARLIALPVALQAGYILWAGGDHMPAARMLVPLVAPAALLVLALGSGVSHRAAQGLTGLAAAAALALALIRPPQTMDPAAFVGGIVGRHIETAWPRDIAVALNTAGSTPFYATEGRVFIDMLGLNDPMIAKRQNVPLRTPAQRWPGHAKGDGRYVLSRRPDRIIIGPAEGRRAEDAWFLSGVEMAETAEFRRCYAAVVEEVPYEAALAAKGPPRPNPLRFTYYRRVCP